MQSFEGRLYESVRDASRSDRVARRNAEAGAAARDQPGRRRSRCSKRSREELPLYEAGEYPAALDFLHLSAGEEILWAAAGAQTTPQGSQRRAS